MTASTDAPPTEPFVTPGSAPRSGMGATVPVQVPLPVAPRRRRRSVWGELWRWAVTLLLFATLAAAAAAALLVVAIYRQARTDQAGPAAAIVVMGTAQWNGVPGPVLRARLDHALDLYRRGLAPLLVVTGGRAPGDAFTEAEAARAYLIEQGVPADAILMENAGRDTWESMNGIAAVARQAGLTRLLLVSDGFHLFRSKLMARDLGLAAAAAPAPNSPIRPGGPVEFSYVLREAAGVVVHLLRQSPFDWPAPAWD